MARIYPNHWHCPPTPLKLQEKGGTVRHALQVLHSLQWNHPGGRALLQLAQAPTQDYHFYTHALLGGVEEEDTSPNGSPVRLQEKHRAIKRLWPNREATTRFPARAWRGGLLFLRA